jgi:hypothetical protein
MQEETILLNLMEVQMHSEGFEEQETWTNRFH